MQFKIANKDKYVHNPRYYFDWDSVWESLVTDYGFTEHNNKAYYKLGNCAIRRCCSFSPWAIDAEYVIWASPFRWQHPDYLETTVN